MRPMPNEHDFPAVTPIDDGQPLGPLGHSPSPNGAAPEDEAPPFALPLEDFIAARDDTRPARLGTPDDNVLPTAGLALLASLPGKGKTTLAVDLAFHLASGVEWLGIPVPGPARVLLIENEGPREPFRRKLEAKAKAWPHPIDGAIHIHVMHWGRFTLDDEHILTDLQPAIEMTDVLIADPLTTLGVRDGFPRRHPRLRRPPRQRLPLPRRGRDPPPPLPPRRVTRRRSRRRTRRAIRRMGRDDTPTPSSKTN